MAFTAAFLTVATLADQPTAQAIGQRILAMACSGMQ
jgi:hypothetical protein